MNTKKEVLYIGTFQLPDLDAASHRVINNAKAFRELGYGTIFLGVKKTINSLIKSNYYGFDVWERKYPNNNIRWFKYMIDYKTIINLIVRYNSIKFIILYNLPSFLMYKLIMYGKKNDIKIISDCTEWYQNRNIIKKIDTKLRMEILNKKTHGVICISSRLEKYYKPFTKTILVPPLIDKNDSIWDITASSPGKRTQFIYSGRPGKHKDKLNLIVQSLNEIALDYSFIILGITEKDYLKYYPQHKNIVLTNKKIKFLGRVKHNDSLQLIKNSDFQIFFREQTRVNNFGFPTKFVESFSLSIPVITNDTSDLSNYISTFNNGVLINDISISEIKNVLSNIINNTKLIETMKKNCGDKNIFDYHNYVNDFKYLFQ